MRKRDLGEFSWNASCDRRGMTAKDPTDLRCWQLANELRGQVNRVCEHPRVANDFRFCEGFRDAAGSVCRNISEGFARFDSGWIVQFFGFALASLAEVKDYLYESETRGIIDKAEFERLLDRCEHTKATTTKFMKPHLAKVRNKSKQRRPTAPP
jgi:four helix bundle protein